MPDTLKPHEIVKAIKDQYQYVVIVYEGDRDFVECHGCNAEVPLSIFESSAMPRGGNPDNLLCELCASTPCGNAVSHPGQYPNRSELQTTVFCANAILTNQGRFKQVEAIEVDYKDLEAALRKEI